MHQKPGYTINLYDSDGDSYMEGIFLFFGDTIIEVADSKEEFDKFLDHLQVVRSQIIDEVE
jgi:hypothetical protein